MNWFTNICSCISPTFSNNIINYLNSSNLNQEIIEEEKVNEETRDTANSQEPDAHIYTFAKNKSYKFMKLDADSDDESPSNKLSQSNNPNEDSEEADDEIMDVFWYPRRRKGESKMSHVRNLCTHKTRIFGILLEQDESSAYYDKVYDSLDELCLKVYCKMESLVKGKKVNSYRFSFNVNGVNLEEYRKWANHANGWQVLPLLEQTAEIERDSLDPNLSISHSHFKKLLVISPQSLVTACRSYQNKQEKSLSTVIFSIRDDQTEKEGYTRAWLHLFGIEAAEGEKGIKILGYLCVDLDVSVSPNMLKQPISKQIRVFAQKLICTLSKSDGI